MVASNEHAFWPSGKWLLKRFILVHVRVILMNCLCQGHPSVNVIDHGHCNAHVCVCVHICVFFSAHAQPFSFSSKYFLHKRQCILHVEKHWTFKVSSMIDNRLLDNMTNIWTQNHYITMDGINLLRWQQTPLNHVPNLVQIQEGIQPVLMSYSGHTHEVWLTTFSAQTLQP